MNSNESNGADFFKKEHRKRLRKAKKSTSCYGHANARIATSSGPDITAGTTELE